MQTLLVIWSQVLLVIWKCITWGLWLDQGGFLPAYVSIFNLLDLLLSLALLYFSAKRVTSAIVVRAALSAFVILSTALSYFVSPIAGRQLKIEVTVLIDTGLHVAIVVICLWYLCMLRRRPRFLV